MWDSQEEELDNAGMSSFPHYTGNSYIFGSFLPFSHILFCISHNEEKVGFFYPFAHYPTYYEKISFIIKEK